MILMVKSRFGICGPGFAVSWGPFMGCKPMSVLLLGLDTMHASLSCLVTVWNSTAWSVSWIETQPFRPILFNHVDDAVMLAQCLGRSLSSVLHGVGLCLICVDRFLYG